MTTDREDENKKFAPLKMKYTIVPTTTINEKHGIHDASIDRKADGKLSMMELSYGHDDKRAIKRGIYHQIIATCAVLVFAAACGMPIGYSAVLLPQLPTKVTGVQMNATVVEQNATTATLYDAALQVTTPEFIPNATMAIPDDGFIPVEPSDIVIDAEMGSWIASVHSLATPVGSLISGPLADYLGRRTTLLVAVVPIVAGWSILATATSFTMIMVGRVCCGFSTGLLGGPAQIYIAETAVPNLRGLLIGAPFVSYSLGILAVYALGSHFNWRTVAWCGNILPLLAAAALCFIPETPAWLLRNRKPTKALNALKFLRGNEALATSELHEMRDRLEKEQSLAKTNENIFKLCCQRVAIKPLFIVIVFSFLQILSGTFIVVFYAIDIIAEFEGDFDTKTAAIWTAVVRTLCTVVFCVLLVFVRRRRVIFVSGIGSALSCLALSVYMYSRVGMPKTPCDMYVGAVCLLSYITFNTPMMMMPAMMTGELFPAKIRGRTAGAVFAAMNVVLFSFTKAFPLIQTHLKMRGVFMIFAVASFLVTLFMSLFQPETKGRTLDQIEDYFNEKHWMWYKRDKSYKVVKQEDVKA